MVVIIIILQCLVIWFWYIENKNDNELNELSKSTERANEGSNYANKSYSNLLESQSFFQDYLKTKNKKYLEKYYESLNDLNSHLDSLDFVLKKDSKSIDDVKYIKQNLDSILSSKSFMLSKKDDTYFDKFDYDGVLNSVNVDSIVTKDSVAKKGFFSRLGDAIFNKKIFKKKNLK